MYGDRDAAFAAATEEIRAGCAQDAQTSWYMAQCYALIGEADEAIDWITTAVSRGFWNYPLFAERDALLASLRSHERYQALMVDLKEKWLNLEA